MRAVTRSSHPSSAAGTLAFVCLAMLACQLPDLSGIDVMIAIRQEFPQARVVMLTTFEGDVEIQRALRRHDAGQGLQPSSGATNLRPISSSSTCGHGST